MNLISLVSHLIQNNVKNGWIHNQDLFWELEEVWDWGRFNADCSDKNKPWQDAAAAIAKLNGDLYF